MIITSQTEGFHEANVPVSGSNSTTDLGSCLGTILDKIECSGDEAILDRAGILFNLASSNGTIMVAVSQCLIG